MKPKILITKRLPQKCLEEISKYFDVELNEKKRLLKRTEIKDKIKGKDALLCLLTDKIDAEIMDVNPNLKVISNYAVGFNNIDIEAATKRSIPVCNTPGVLTDATADIAFALLISSARRIVESDVYMRKGKFKAWDPLLLLGSDLHKKTLGILGMGRIGQAMAKRARGFDMKIIYSSPRTHPEAEKEFGATKVDFDTFLTESDFISLHIPLLEKTHHLFGENEFKKMKKSAHIINTSRGPVIDEKALVKALKNNEIAGAGLDVFEDEPKLSPGLKDLNNAVILPHIGSATIGTRETMGMIAFENAKAIFENKKPISCVNEKVLI